jgi:hypothetical protein
MIRICEAIIPDCFSESACRKCHGKVFDLERITSKSGVWHRQCFNCSGCSCTLTSTLDNAFDQGADGQIYCRPCLKKYVADEQLTMPSSPKSALMPIDKSDPSACPRCGGRVFEAEKMSTRNRLFHKQCFSCCQCNHGLDYTNCMEGPNNEIYCKTCYVKEYFTGGRNKFGDNKSGPEGMKNDPDVCPRCQRKVYDVEKIILRFDP